VQRPDWVGENGFVGIGQVRWVVYGDDDERGETTTRRRRTRRRGFERQ
jgi:hypothetical protein